MTQKQENIMKFEISVLKSSLVQKNNMIYSQLIKIDDLQNELDKITTDYEIVKFQLKQYQQAFLEYDEDNQKNPTKNQNSFFDYFQKKKHFPEQLQNKIVKNEKDFNVQNIENKKYLLVNELCNQISVINKKLTEHQQTILEQQLTINKLESQQLLLNKEILSMKKQAYEYEPIQKYQSLQSQKPKDQPKIKISDFSIMLNQVQNHTDKKINENKTDQKSDDSNVIDDIQYQQGIQKIKEKTRMFFKDVNKVILNQTAIDKNYFSDDKYEDQRLSVIFENSFEQFPTQKLTSIYE